MILVHSKTCFTPESMIDRNEREEGITEAIGDGCRHKALMTASKEELINKIFALEHEIVIKQLETHEASK